MMMTAAKDQAQERGDVGCGSTLPLLLLLLLPGGVERRGEGGHSPRSAGVEGMRRGLSRVRAMISTTAAAAA